MTMLDKKKKTGVVLAMVVSTGLMLTTTSFAGEKWGIWGKSDKKPDTRVEMAERSKAYYYYMSGHTLKKNGYTKDALELYKKAIAIDGDSTVLNNEIAELYLQLGKYELAKTHLLKAIKKDPKYTPSHVLLAELYTILKENDKAAKSYNKAIELEPDNHSNYLYFATFYARINEYDKGINVLKRLLKKKPGSIMAYYYMAKIEVKRDNLTKAEKYYEKTISLNNRFSPAYSELAMTYEADKKPDMAEKTYRKAIAIIQPPKDFLLRLATLLLKNDKLEDALKIYTQLTEYSSTRYGAMAKIGLIRFEQENFSAAIKEFSALLSENPKLNKIRYYLATSYESKGDIKKASEEFARIPVDDSSYVDAKVHLSYIFQQQGKIPESIQELKDALKAKKNDPDLIRLIVTVMREDKRYDEAIGIVKNAINDDPGNAELYFTLGVIYDDTGKDQLVFSSMEKTIELNPRHTNALNYLGYSYAEKGIRLDKAEQYLKKALEIKPGNGFYLDSLGWVYYKQGNYDKAIKNLSEAVKLLPEDPVIAEHLGDAYRKKNLKEKALTFYENASNLNSKNKSLRTKIETLKKEIPAVEAK